MILIEISQLLQHKYRVCEVHTKTIFFSDIRKIHWHRPVSMKIQVISPKIVIKMWVVSVKVRHLQAELFSNHRIAIVFLWEVGGGRECYVFNVCGYVSVCLCVEGGSSENNSVALTLVDFILGIRVIIYSFDTNLSRLIKTQRVLWPISEYLLKSLQCKVCNNTTKGKFHNGMKFGWKNPTITPWWLRQTSYVIFGII